LFDFLSQGVIARASPVKKRFQVPGRLAERLPENPIDLLAAFRVWRHHASPFAMVSRG
jgi:hypothetical protein